MSVIVPDFGTTFCKECPSSHKDVVSELCDKQRRSGELGKEFPRGRQPGRLPLKKCLSAC